MKHLAIVALALIGCVEFILRVVAALALIVSVLGILVLMDNEDLLRPVSWEIAKGMAGIR